MCPWPPSAPPALPVIALWLVDAGETERVVELYALATRYGHVAHSRWYEDVAGKPIVASAAAMPPEVVAVAQERGRARDLEATVEGLLAGLEVEDRGLGDSALGQ